MSPRHTHPPLPIPPAAPTSFVEPRRRTATLAACAPTTGGGMATAMLCAITPSAAMTAAKTRVTARSLICSLTIHVFSPGCPSTALMGNGVCDANCNVTACYNDGGDCLTFTAVDCSPGCPISWIGDGICDTACQTPECSDDAGDCTTSGIAAPSAVALYSSCAHASCPSGAPTTLAALVAPMTTQWCIATSARRAFAPLSPLTRSLSCVNSRRSVARTCPWTVHGARRTAAGWHPARER